MGPFDDRIGMRPQGRSSPKRSARLRRVASLSPWLYRLDVFDVFPSDEVVRAHALSTCVFQSRSQLAITVASIAKHDEISSTLRYHVVMHAPEGSMIMICRLVPKRS